MPNINSPTPDATNTTKGKIQLAGDLSGTAVAPTLSTSAVFLGYTQITSNFTTTATSATQVTGLSVTVTIPSGSRRVKITAYGPDNLVSTLANHNWQIWDGTVGSGTLLQTTQTTSGGANYHNQGNAIWVGTPTAGSKTYNVSFFVSGGTGTVSAAATAPAFILVELM